MKLTTAISTLGLVSLMALLVACSSAEVSEPQQPQQPAVAAPAAPAAQPVTSQQRVPAQPAAPQPAAPAAAPQQAAVRDAPTAVPPVTRISSVEISSEEGQPKFGGTASGIGQANFPAVDAQWTGATVVQYLPSNMSETLFTRDFEDQIQPMLTESWDVSDDGLVWTFTIRSGLMFHNGEPVTAEDVIGSYERANTAFIRRANDVTNEITADSDVDLSFHLSEPSGLPILALTTPPGHRGPWVQPREIWEVPNTTAVDYISSTGPYKFVEWYVGDRVIMERWEDYQPRAEESSYMSGGHTAYIDKVEWLEVPDFATRVAALTTGQVDWVDEYPSDFAPRVEESANSVFTTGKPGRLVGMWPSHTHPPFDNQRVRQAVQMAMDNDKILGIAAGGPKGQFWDTCSGFMGCGINQTVWDSSGVPGTEVYNVKDLETAKKIIEEEGMVGVKVRLTSPEDLAMFKDTTRPFKELLEQLGFEVEFIATDWGTVAALYNDADSFDLGITGTKLGYNVSPLQFDWFLTADGARNGYSDPSGNMKKYFDQMARESDFEAIKAISDKVHAQFYEDVPMFYFGQQTWANGRSARIKNFANKHTPFWPNAWLEE